MPRQHRRAERRTCPLDPWALAIDDRRGGGRGARRARRAAALGARRARPTTTTPRPPGRIHFLAVIGMTITPLFLAIILMSGLGRRSPAELRAVMSGPRAARSACSAGAGARADAAAQPPQRRSCARRRGGRARSSSSAPSSTPATARRATASTAAGSARAAGRRRRRGRARRCAASARWRPTSTCAPATCRSATPHEQPTRARVLFSDREIATRSSPTSPRSGGGPADPAPRPGGGTSPRAASCSPSTARAATRSSAEGGDRAPARKAPPLNGATPRADRRGGAHRAVRDADVLRARTSATPS